MALSPHVGAMRMERAIDWETVRPMVQRRPAPVLWRRGTTLSSSPSYHVMVATSDIDTKVTITSATDPQPLLCPPKLECNARTESPPPTYESLAGIAPVIPATGDLSMGAFEQLVITPLDPLEAAQESIAARSLDAQQPHNRHDIRHHSFQSRSAHIRQQLRRVMDGWRENHRRRTEAYRMWFQFKKVMFRVSTLVVRMSLEDSDGDCPAHRHLDLAEMEEAERTAAWLLVTARRLIRSVKAGPYHCAVNF